MKNYYIILIFTLLNSIQISLADSKTQKSPFPTSASNEYQEILKKCDRNIPTFNLRPGCFQNRQSKSELQLTSNNLLRFKLKSEVAQLMYLHMLYWLEVKQETFTSDSRVYGKNINCKKQKSKFECEMYWDLQSGKFIEANYKDFKKRATGIPVGKVYQADFWVELKLETSKFRLKILDFKNDGDKAAKILFKLASQFNESISSSGAHLITRHNQLICFKESEIQFHECRILLDLEIGATSPLPEINDFLNPYWISSAAFAIWNNGQHEEEVPEE